MILVWIGIVIIVVGGGLAGFQAWRQAHPPVKNCATGWHRIVDDGWDPYKAYRCYKCLDCDWHDMRGLHELIPGVPLDPRW